MRLSLMRLQGEMDDALGDCAEAAEWSADQMDVEVLATQRYGADMSRSCMEAAWPDMGKDRLG
jgi:hypothetical protein